MMQPMIKPSRIRVVELNPTETLAAVDRAALGDADVVLFERALAPLVAEAVPPMAYAEPLSAEFQAAPSQISPRAAKLAAEGWRVVQCVLAHPDVLAQPGVGRAAPDMPVVSLGAAAPIAGQAAQSLVFTANGLAG
jgi:hypothetical protein